MNPHKSTTKLKMKVSLYRKHSYELLVQSIRILEISEEVNREALILQQNRKHRLCSSMNLLDAHAVTLASSDSSNIVNI